MRWADVDGKKALIFDEIPAFLFVSTDGTFRMSKLYLDGEWDRSIYGLTVNGEIDGLVTYTASKYALSKNDAVFK